MSEPRSTAEQRLYELWSEYVDLHAAESLLEWDQETKMAPKGHGPRGEVLATIAAYKHRCLTSSEMREVLEACAESASPGSVLASQVRAVRHAVDRAVKVPERLKKEIAAARSAAFAAWEESRNGAGFAGFEKPLERLVALSREEAAAIAGSGELYDALVDRYEPGAKTAELVPLFEGLTKTLTPLVRAVVESGVVVDETPAFGHFPGDRQVEFGRFVSAAVGYDFKGGRLDKSPHPFCIRIHRNDVRITYRYREDDFRSCFFGILHETGHGLYEQGLPEDFHRTPIDDSVSLGIHESQSLLWEKHVGGSRGFWRWLLPRFRETFPDSTLAVADLWPTLHTVKPSLIRVDADETTYNLHIAIRFEIERALFASSGGDLKVRDLPQAWNDLYEKYLGVRPQNDKEGVLQDIHWSHGSFGYFPTYTLGMLISAQLMTAARRDLGDLDTAFAAGEFQPLLGWLRERLHGEGRRHLASELIESVTGRPLGTHDFVGYLKEHTEAVYGVS